MHCLAVRSADNFVPPAEGAKDKYTMMLIL